MFKHVDMVEGRDKPSLIRESHQAREIWDI